ncbi:unnamed protein product [Hermetia illucens]|uniref:Uncharacterized protein n=1 Tax=Hermetia illucens TaxID=343691 RepID=A0A7R8UN14_HERIL|nr:unnamed protein product [Hermetia illucens]
MIPNLRGPLFLKGHAPKSTVYPEKCPNENAIKFRDIRKQTEEDLYPLCIWYSKLISTTVLILHWLTVAFVRDYEIFQLRHGFYIESLASLHVESETFRLTIVSSTEEMLKDQNKIANTWLHLINK